MSSRFEVSLLAACFLAIAISGCTSASPTSLVQAPDRTSKISALLPYRDVLYVSDVLDDRVDLYPLNANDPPSLGSIFGIDVPTGMAVDVSHKLYVAHNEGEPPDVLSKDVETPVTVYLPGHDRPAAQYVQDLRHPTDVVVGTDGTVYVANFGDGYVTEFPPGSYAPSLNFQPPSGTAIGLALDASNDLYVSCAVSNAVFEFAPGSTHGTNLGLALGGEPHGMAFDANGDLLVAVSAAPNSGSVIDVFPPGKTQPSKQIAGTFQPFMIAFDRSKRHLYVADFGSGNHDGGVFEFAYPSGTLVSKYAQGGATAAYGVAVNPPAAP